MTIVSSLTFEDAKKQIRTVRFVRSEEEHETSRPSASRFKSTVITGQNGSSKSTMLRKLVEALVLTGRSGSTHIEYSGERPAHVICLPGSGADRFPPKDNPGGGKSEYDVPRYAYLGQRVGPNLLSKKLPLETMLTFALDEGKRERMRWRFFGAAHRFAGIHPHTEYELFAKRRPRDPETIDVRRTVEALANGQTFHRHNRPLPNVTQATAQDLLRQFTAHEFTALQQLVSRASTVRLELSADGVRSSLSSHVLRLGLLTDLLSLAKAEAHSIEGSTFPLYELSSGEFHMFTSLLNLGLGMEADSVVMVDEPENSLHPQWQRDLMEYIFEISEQVLQHGHLIVCTHSPLIVSAATQDSSIVDLTYETPTVDNVSFGASSDELLLTQFGVGSSRNHTVVAIVQRAITLVEQGKFRELDSGEMQSELASVHDALSERDPLRDIVSALMEGGEVR